MMDAQELIDELDKVVDGRGSWDIYRAGEGHWVLKIELDGMSQTETDLSITKVMRKALEWEPLPSVPRMPMALSPECLSVEKCRSGGRTWDILLAGNVFHRGLPRKKDAEAWIVTVCKQREEFREWWIEHFGWTIDKVEGVDFRYRS